MIDETTTASTATEETSKKQVIVMRTDLNMRKGKMIAQGAHASMKAILDRGFVFQPLTVAKSFCIPLTDDIDQWLTGNFKKICVRADTEEDIKNFYQQAAALKIPCALIVDSGLTEFGGVPTITCCAIGPADDEVVNRITGHLKLL